MKELLALACMTLLASPDHAADAQSRSARRLVFFGDSITEQGALPGGYVTIIRDSIQSNPATSDVEVVGAGVSGNKVTDLLDRVDHDVLARRPDIVVIYIGINDVWHFTMPFHTGTTAPRFAAGLAELVTRIQTAGGRVVICTPSVVGEKARGLNRLDPLLDEYADTLRSVAGRFHAPLVDLRNEFFTYLASHNPDHHNEGILTVDGVHLSQAGNRFVADAILRVLKESGYLASR